MMVLLMHYIVMEKSRLLILENKIGLNKQVYPHIPNISIGQNEPQPN